jgi:predicted nucleic-acid-binding protein
MSLCGKPVDSAPPRFIKRSSQRAPRKAGKRPTSRRLFGNISVSAMLAVDPNVLVRLIARDDADQVRVAEVFVSKGAWVSHLVLAETMWVLDSVYGLSREKISTALEMLLNHQELTLQDSEVVAAALELFRRRTTVDFSDCLVLEIARKAGHIPIATFDRHFAKLDGIQRLR